MAKKSLKNAADRDELTLRVKRLTPQSTRLWGKMTPGETLCHLTDSFQVALGSRPARPAVTFAGRTVMRFFALHTSMKWPPDVPSRPEVLPGKQGTKPGNFESDRLTLLETMAQMANRPSPNDWAAHPIFGRLSTDEWLVWGYRHMDHHLRQFGC